MDPIIAGLLSRLGYDALKTGIKLPLHTSIEDHLDSAAESVAERHSGLSADDLLGLMESQEMAEYVESFDGGRPLPIEDLVQKLQAHSVNKFLDEDASSVIEEFLTAFEQELAAKPELWRQIVLQYLKAQRESVKSVRAGQEIHFETLQSAIETVKADVETLHGIVEPEELDEALDGLQRDGFRLLTSMDFKNGECEPDNCWRRPFYLQEIRAGYAIERERPPMDELNRDDIALDGGRTNVVQQLSSELRGGNECVVVGNPGSGKSTLLKTVADRWDRHDDMGTILYRGHGEGSAHAMDSADGFIDNVETVAEQQGPVLVVVEDAARDATVPLFESIYRHLDDNRVSYLLDSRVKEWDDERFEDRLRRNDTIDRESEVGRYIWNTFSNHIETVPVPPLDKHEVERIIDQFESISESDEDVTATPQEIFDQIQSHHGVSSLLLLFYYLPVGGIQPDATSKRSILEQNVIEVYDAINYPSESDRTLAPSLSESEQFLFEQLGLAITTLNLMEIGVHRELLLTLASTQDERQQIDAFLETLLGTLVFGKEGNQYYSHHELWSYFYLKRHLNEHKQAATPRQEFENCTNALFSIADEDTRDGTRGHVGHSSLFDLIEENVSEFVENFIRDLFGVVERRAQLIPLYGGSDYSDINLPEECSIDLEITCARIRRDAWLRQGDRSDLDGYRHVKKENEVIRQRQLEQAERDPMKIDAAYFFRRGEIHHQKGRSKELERWTNRALHLFHDIGDRAGEASSLGNLGLVALEQGDYEAAREYHQQSLEIERELGNRAGEASSLGNLGNVAREQDDLADAQEYYERASDRFLELGAPRRALTALSNLSKVATDREDTETTRKACEMSLALIEETDLPGLDERAREFRIRLDRLGDTSTSELYARGLEHVLANEGDVAMELLEDTWERRKEVEPSDEAHPLVLGAGVGFAVHLGLLDSDEAEADPDTVLSTIEPDADDLSPAARALFDHLMESEPAVTSDDLRENAAEIDDDEHLTDQLDALEARAYARLLEVLTGTSAITGGDDIKDVPTDTIYEQALVEMAGDDADPKIVVALFNEAWERRNDHDPGSDHHAMAMASGVGLVAHVELLDTDIEDDDTTPEKILNEINPHTDYLPPAARATYQHLVGEEPSATPDELFKPVDSEDPTLEDIETLVFATCLDMLR